MSGKEVENIVERIIRFNNRQITQLKTMNALLKFTYTVDTSDSGKVCVSTTVQTTVSARPTLKGETPDE